MERQPQSRIYVQNQGWFFVDSPDGPGTITDIRDTAPEWLRQRGIELPPERKKLPYSLLNVGLALTDLFENDFTISEQTRIYIQTNEKTKAFEIAARGAEMRTYQYWDPECQVLIAYAVTTEEIYERGLKQACELRESFGSKIDFEIERREIELKDSKKLNSAIASGLMDTHIKITISPYPEGEDPETAGILGYFPDKGISMIRVHEYNPETKELKANQIRLDQTNLEAFTRMVELFSGQEIESVLSPSEILAAELYVPKVKVRGGVVDVARIYDRILQNQRGGTYFLGERKSRPITEYGSISGTTKLAEEVSKPIVNDLVEQDIQLAYSLYKGLKTKYVENKIRDAIKQIDSGGTSLLNNEQKSILVNNLTENFTVEAAEILKEYLTKSSILQMLCLTDPERAKEIFNPGEVEKFQNVYLETPQYGASLPSLQLNQVFKFYSCGEALTISSMADLFNLTQSEFGNFMIGSETGDAGDGKGPLIFKCSNGHRNRRPFGGTIPNCTTCGTSVGC